MLGGKITIKMNNLNTQDKKTLTICLLTFNSADYLPYLFKSLVEQTFKDWNLLVLDNASVDNSVALVKEYYPPAKIITQKQNLGFAKGHNLLINWSDSKYVLILNQDLILAPDYLAKTIEFLDTHPKVASVSGKLLYWDFPSLTQTKQIDSYGLKIDKHFKVSDWQQGEQDYDLADQEMFGLSATALMIRREALESIKFYKTEDTVEYFDEDFFSYKEDVDLAWRLRLLGWQNYLVTCTRAYHHRSLNKDTQRKQRGILNKLSYRNHFAVLYKNTAALKLGKFWWSILTYEIKKFFYFLLFERKTLVGLKEFLFLKKKFKAKRKYIKKRAQVTGEELNHWFK